MNSTYISIDKIKDLSKICEETFTNEIKTNLKKLSNKYNLSFGVNRSINLKMFWQYCVNELSKDNLHKINTGQTLKEAIAINLKTGNATLMISDYVNAYIERNYKEDYKFLMLIDSEQFMFTITQLIKIYGFNIDFTANDLFNVTDYVKYFTAKYGINNCDKKTLQATQNIVNFIEALTKDVKNKKSLMYAITVYMENYNHSELHTILHI